MIITIIHPADTPFDALVGVLAGFARSHDTPFGRAVALARAINIHTGAGVDGTAMHYLRHPDGRLALIVDRPVPTWAIEETKTNESAPRP